MGKENEPFSFDNWTTQMRKGLLELCLLNLLHSRQIYGYDLVKRLSAVPGLVVTEGTIYPLLSRLRKTGLVDSRLVESESGPARRYYLLTAQGRRQLAAMNAYWGGLVQGIASLLKGEG